MTLLGKQVPSVSVIFVLSRREYPACFAVLRLGISMTPSGESARDWNKVEDSFTVIPVNRERTIQREQTSDSFAGRPRP
jgi:hypothetical protein